MLQRLLTHNLQSALARDTISSGYVRTEEATGRDERDGTVSNEHRRRHLRLPAAELVVSRWLTAGVTANTSWRGDRPRREPA